MSDDQNFSDILNEIIQHWIAATPKDIKAAMDLIHVNTPRFKNNSRFKYYSFNYRFCGAALLNKTTLALQTLQDSLDAGYFWPAQYLKTDTDLTNLHGLPEFDRIVEASEKKFREATARTQPQLLTLPLPKIDPPFPLLLALHGNTENIDITLPYWQSAISQGWLTALPQSSQPLFPGGYVWDNIELGAKDLKALYQDLTQKHPIDPNKLVLGGFSMGGALTLWVALNNTLPLAGFIAVNPGGGIIANPDQWDTLLDGCKRLTEMRGFFLVGETDPSRENITAFHERLTARGMPAEFVVAEGVGHDYPDNFDEVLTEALAFISE